MGSILIQRPLWLVDALLPFRLLISRYFVRVRFVVPEIVTISVDLMP